MQKKSHLQRFNNIWHFVIRLGINSETDSNIRCLLLMTPTGNKFIYNISGHPVLRFQLKMRNLTVFINNRNFVGRMSEPGANIVQ